MPAVPSGLVAPVTSLPGTARDVRSQSFDARARMGLPRRASRRRRRRRLSATGYRDLGSDRHVCPMDQLGFVGQHAGVRASDRVIGSAPCGAAMSGNYRQGKIHLKQISAAYWRVTFDLPPLNIFGPASIPELEAIVSLLESDDRAKVVVSDSAVDGFFLTHYDFLAKPEESAAFHPGRTGLQPLPDMLVRLSRASVVSISSIRGRATGVGSELALACDMRIASRERAVLSQWEVGAGLVPGGERMARLPRLIGRGRALEVLLGADDIAGDVAELYGYVNRALPAQQLDAFVDTFAARIASFDKEAIAETKRLVNLNSLPSDDEIAPEWPAFIAALGRPASQMRLRALFERGFHTPGDVETRLGFHVGSIGLAVEMPENRGCRPIGRTEL